MPATSPLTPDNTTAPKAEIANLDEQLGRRPTLPPLLHHRLSKRREQLHHFLRRQEQP